MTADPYAWRARVLDEGYDFARDQRRLVIWRNQGETTHVVTGFDEQGLPVITERPFGTASDFRGFAIPDEAIEALAEWLRPGPSTSELGRMDEALAVERKRVDDLLARAEIASAR